MGEGIIKLAPQIILQVGHPKYEGHNEVSLLLLILSSELIIIIVGNNSLGTLSSHRGGPAGGRIPSSPHDAGQFMPIQLHFRLELGPGCDLCLHKSLLLLCSFACPIHEPAVSASSA